MNPRVKKRKKSYAEELYDARVAIAEARYIRAEYLSEIYYGGK